jgi:HK97 family phage major capsid protein
MAMGPTVVPVDKELRVPSIASGATAYYVPENSRIPPSEPTFAEQPLLTPKELAALVPVSDRLLRDAATNPALEDALRTARPSALTLDAAGAGED